MITIIATVQPVAFCGLAGVVEDGDYPAFIPGVESRIGLKGSIEWTGLPPIVLRSFCICYAGAFTEPRSHGLILDSFL